MADGGSGISSFWETLVWVSEMGQSRVKWCERVELFRRSGTAVKQLTRDSAVGGTNPTNLGAHCLKTHFVGQYYRPTRRAQSFYQVAKVESEINRLLSL